MHGGVRGRKTKVGRKLLRFPPTLYLPVGVTGFEPATTRPTGAYFMICIFCIYLIFSMVFIDYQLFNFYKFSSVLMVFTQNVVDLL